MACISKRRGRYVIDFYDNQGIRRWRTMPLGTTKAKTRELLREIEEQLARGTYVPEKKRPPFKVVAESWLEHKKMYVRKSTWEGYEGHLKLHFRAVEHTRIDRITTAQVEKFITNKYSNGMSLSTLKKVLITFNQVMKYAVRHGYISYNPVRDAERPKNQGKSKKLEIVILSSAQINALIDAESDPKYKMLFTMAIMTGARQGELLGLKWKDVNWVDSQVHIQRTYNKRTWYDPKSETSDRHIDIGPETMQRLKQWMLACPPSALGLVFPNRVGGPLCESHMMSRHFRPAVKKAGIPKMRFHDLRHTYASLLIEQGENIKYIQTQLGHSSPTVTLDVYAHLMTSVNTESARRLEKGIFQSSGSKMVAKIEKGSA